MKKLRIGLLVMLIMGICVIPASAVKILDVNYLLKPVGELYDSASNSDYYGQTYDVLYIQLETSARINLQVRGEGGEQLVEWAVLSGTINETYVLQESRSVHIYVENLETFDTTVIGELHWNMDAVTTNTTPTENPVEPMDAGLAITILFIIYGIAGVLFITAVIVYRRRKNPDFSYLVMIDDEKLLPTDWQPDEEI